MEDKEFFDSFVVVSDKITVLLQLQQITERAKSILENRSGNIIPKQTKQQLLALYTEAINSLYP